MKKLSILILSIFSIVALSSCDKGEMGPVVNSDPGSPEITSPSSGESYTLNEDNAQDTLLTMEWNAPDYGFSAAPSIIIQMDDAGNDFADPKEFTTTFGTSHAIMVEAMNSKLLGLGYAPEQQVNLDFRVMASLSDSMEQKVSEPITLSFTPYSTCKYCDNIYVPGSYQSASGYTNDWSPADAPNLKTVDLTDNYEGYVYMANDGNQFKFTADQTWTTNWGDNGADGSLEQDGANITADAGYYKINVDLLNNTYTMTNTTWGLIGSATADGWNSDQNMTYDPDAKVWTITTDLSAGDIKFRANDAWDINYGDTGADGTLEAGGDNISVSSAGNYTIELDLNNHPYSYTLTQN